MWLACFFMDFVNLGVGALVAFVPLLSAVPFVPPPTHPPSPSSCPYRYQPLGWSDRYYCIPIGIGEFSDPSLGLAKLAT